MILGRAGSPRKRGEGKPAPEAKFSRRRGVSRRYPRPAEPYDWGRPVPRPAVLDPAWWLFLVGWAGTIVLVVAGLHQIVGGGR